MKFDDMAEFESPQNIIKIVASNPLEKTGYLRICLRKLGGKDENIYFAESFTDKQAFHKRINVDDLQSFCNENLFGKYKQILVCTTTDDITYLTSAKGTTKRLVKKRANVVKETSQNRRKNYILREGMPILPFVDLGIFTKDFKVVNSMYDKYKQINRFVEILDDKFSSSNEPLTVLDFGCGKSYLTFIVHYYFTQIRKQQVRIIGYDMKSDVVDNCNKLAEKYGCKDLTFVVADVTRDKLFQGKVDAVICLHACDVATDYALNFAVKNEVKYIFSVPCCQHEINQTIHSGGELDILLKYGLLKERTCALLTDGIRAQILEDCGYSVDLTEFVDFAHSPKNIMIRAERTHAPRFAAKQRICELKEKYGFSQTLYDLIYGKD